jgi:hypothetical protein
VSVRIDDDRSGREQRGGLRDNGLIRPIEIHARNGRRSIQLAQCECGCIRSSERGVQ